MKVLIAFLICIIVEVSGIEEEITIELLKKYSRSCIQELQLDQSLINDKDPSMDDIFNENGCYRACMDKKLGVMNQDGTYSLERIMSFEERPEQKRRAERAFNKIKKACASIDNKDPCKAAACFHKTVEDMAMNNE